VSNRIKGVFGLEGLITNSNWCLVVKTYKKIPILSNDLSTLSTSY
jgi:hypothetical protein